MIIGDLLLWSWENLRSVDDMQKIISVLIVGVMSLFAAVMKTRIFQNFMSGIIFSISGKFLEKFLNIFRRKNKKKKTRKGEEISEGGVTESEIINHDIFNYIDFWLYNQIPTLTLRTQYRTAIFRKYLHIYFKTYKDVIADFVRTGSYKSMDHSELRKTLLRIITDVTQRMEIEMRTVQIPEVIIIKMKNVLNDRIQLTLDLINSICDSSFYDSENNLLKIYSFLNIVHSILDNTISNVEPVCNGLNGELNGLSIDGYTEPMSDDK